MELRKQRQESGNEEGFGVYRLALDLSHQVTNYLCALWWAVLFTNGDNNAYIIKLLEDEMNLDT